MKIFKWILGLAFVLFGIAAASESPRPLQGPEQEPALTQALRGDSVPDAIVGVIVGSVLTDCAIINSLAQNPRDSARAMINAYRQDPDIPNDEFGDGVRDYLDGVLRECFQR